MACVKDADLKYLKKIVLVLGTSILLSILLMASTSSPVLADIGDEIGNFTTGGPIRSSAAIAYLDGDDCKDIVIGSSDGMVYALSVCKGTVLGSFDTGGTIYYSSPVIIDIISKDLLVIVVGSNNYTTEKGKTYVINGKTGEILKKFNTSSFIESSTAFIRLKEWYPTVDDDDFVVLMGSYDKDIYAFRINASAPDGTGPGKRYNKLWNTTLGGEIWASAALGDIRGNGKPQVLVGARDGKLYALNRTGYILANFTTGGKIMSSPAINNTDDDPDLEVVFGSNDGKVYAVNGTGTTIREEWNRTINLTTDSRILSSPKIADLDDDGQVEVVIASYDGNVCVLNGSTGKIVWNSTTGGKIRSSPAIADVTGDTILDVVIGSLDGKLYVFNGSDGSESWNFTTGGEIWSSPAIASVNGDEIDEIIIGAAYPEEGYGKVYVIDPLGESTDDGCSEWRMFGGNLKHTNYVEISSPISPPVIEIEAVIDIDPDTLNLKSKGKWITCYIELPELYDVSEINVSTIRLNDAVHAEVHPTEIGDYDDDGIPDLMVKFDRSEVQEMLEPGDKVEIKVTGKVAGESFEGTDTIRVISKGGSGIAKLKLYIVSLLPMR